MQFLHLLSFKKVVARWRPVLPAADREKRLPAQQQCGASLVALLRRGCLYAVLLLDGIEGMVTDKYEEGVRR
jgi:hypothetical protein